MATKSKAWLSAIATIAIVAISVLTFAFKAEDSLKSINNTVKRASLWYQYNGGPQNDASSYTLLEEQPADGTEAGSFCPGLGEICLVNAPEGMDEHPAAFDVTLIGEINAALVSGEETSNVKLKAD